MHGPRFAALFAVDEDRRCWRCAVTSVLECWLPVWANRWCSQYCMTDEGFVYH